MDALLRILVVLNMLQSAGCAHGPERMQSTSGEGTDLQSWVDTQLSPYLVQQLGGHPRFKDQSVILVKLDGPDVQPSIDDLTRSVRTRVHDMLLSTPGVRLPWQPRQPQATHHRRLEDVNCARIRDADYYIGLEIGRLPDERYRVSVRALDVRAGEWVSGFGESWEGHLTPREQQEFAHQRMDESLRGLRVLPFGSGQSDLAATYLANNVSCLLRQHDEDDLVVFVKPLTSDQPELRTVLDLVGNNLSRFREVRVTDRSGEAGFVLRGEAHRISANLYQMWIVLTPRRSGEHLTGTDTATYIAIQPDVTVPGKTFVAKKRADGKPDIAGFDLLRTKNGDDDAHCANGSDNDGCRTLRMVVDSDSEVFLFAHGVQSGVVRLSPGSCARVRRNAGEGYVTRFVSFPESQLPVRAQDSIYGVAVNDDALGERFRQLLQVVPDGCDRAVHVRLDGDRLDRWLIRLDQLLEKNRERIAWTARRVD